MRGNLTPGYGATSRDDLSTSRGTSTLCTQGILPRYNTTSGSDLPSGRSASVSCTSVYLPLDRGTCTYGSLPFSCSVGASCAPNTFLPRLLAGHVGLLAKALPHMHALHHLQALGLAGADLDRLAAAPALAHKLHALRAQGGQKTPGHGKQLGLGVERREELLGGRGGEATQACRALLLKHAVRCAGRVAERLALQHQACLIGKRKAKVLVHAHEHERDVAVHCVVGRVDEHLVHHDVVERDVELAHVERHAAREEVEHACQRHRLDEARLGVERDRRGTLGELHAGAIVLPGAHKFGIDEG